MKEKGGGNSRKERKDVNCRQHGVLGGLPTFYGCGCSLYLLGGFGFGFGTAYGAIEEILTFA